MPTTTPRSTKSRRPTKAFRQFQYLSPPEHLSGRDLADKLNRGMQHIHGWRVEMLARLSEQAAGASRA